MKEADRILIDSLISVGLELEDESVTLEQFSPDILINATSLCLEYIFESRNEHQSFPKSCPVNMASRYKVGQALSEAIKSLGYKDALGYQSFLYPNVKDSRNIISVLIVNLPKDSGPSVVEGLDQSGRLNSVIKIAFSDNWKSPWLPFYCRDIEAVSKPVNCSYRSALMPFESERIQPVSAVSPGAAVAASGRGGLSTDIERTTMRKVIAQRLTLSKGRGRRVQRYRGVACDGCSWRQGIEQQRPDPAARQGHRPGQFVRLRRPLLTPAHRRPQSTDQCTAGFAIGVRRNRGRWTKRLCFRGNECHWRWTPGRGRHRRVPAVPDSNGAAQTHEWQCSYHQYQRYRLITRTSPSYSFPWCI